MQVLVLSPPSAVAEWLVPLIRELIAVECGPADFLHLSTVEALKTDWSNRKHEHLFLFSDAPDAEISRVLGHGNVPAILIREDPVASALYLHKHKGHDLAAAVRVTSLSFAALHEVILKANDLFVLPESKSLTRSSAIADLRSFLAMRSGGSSPQAPQQGRLPGKQIRPAEDAASIHASEELEIGADPLFDVLKSYRALYHFAPAEAFSWATELFLTTNPLGAPLLGTIDLMGRARPFLYGPYLHLPVGAWNAHIAFDVRGNTSGNVLFLEVLAGNMLLSSWSAELPKDGGYEATVSFSVVEPRTPLEIRMSVLEGAIEGMFTLRNVNIDRAS